MVLSVRNKGKCFSSIVKITIMFLYVYNCAIVGLLTCENLAIMIGFLFIVLKGKLKIDIANQSINRLKPAIYISFFALLYTSMLVLLWGTDKSHETVPWYLCMLFIYGTLAYIVFINIFDSTDDFFRTLILVSIIQGIIVVSGMIIPSIGELIDGLYINTRVGWDYSYMRQYGYPGGINCITSTGALQLSLGLIACLYFLIKKNNKLYLCPYLFIAFCATAVARTGLVVAICGILFYFWVSSGTSKVKIICALFFSIILFVIIINSLGLNDKLVDKFQRLLDLKENGLNNVFLDYYFQRDEGLIGENGIPPLSWKTIVGSGITSGTSGNGVYVNADGGFFRLYAGMGLPLALVFYLIIFRSHIKTCKMVSDNGLRHFGIFLLIFLIIGELKEPYIIFKRYPIVLIAVFFYLVFENNRVSKNNDCFFDVGLRI